MTTQTDVVIIGAGPVGLFQVFELGLQGLNAVIVDALPDPGGQCIELYPDKPIYDIPAVPMCTGRELIEKLMDQIAPFEAPLHLDQMVDSLVKNDDGSFNLETSKGLKFQCKAVVVAAGAGSFTPVKLRVDEIDTFEGGQLLYRVRKPDAHAGKNLVILGGGDSAVDWALALADKAASLTLVNRTERFRAVESSVDKLMALQGAGKVQVLYGAVKDFTQNDGVLQSVQCVMRDEEKSTLDLPVDDLLVFFGLSPKLGPVEEWGMNLERNLVTVDCETFATSVPGLYAVGDINTYPGKKKLILSGFHETAVAAHAIKRQFEPDKKQYTQYTTTSTLLQRRLGVDENA
ncbi:UNVERIFIED_CONTAM: hypothetical protein GTU68_040512 [Idotea baltica]|nr:hypothetical protein [Idotea baltica]